MPITAFYAALLTLLFIVLSVLVIRARGNAGTALGDGNDARLQRRIRVHANFAEYVPLALLLMALAESMTASRYLLHLFGVVLVVARIVHAYGVSQENENLTFRVLGIGLTLTMLGAAALTCLAMAVRGLGLP